MRTRSVVIALLAVAGFVAILQLTARRESEMSPASAPAPVAPPPPPPAAAEPAGPEVTPEPDEISVRTLVDEMVDLERLARLPVVPFTAGQVASTDRRSRAPEDAMWFANDDFVTDTQPNLVRVESLPDGHKRWVLADLEGPGAILRIWTATPAGTLRIYIDGAATPALEAPMAALLRGDVPPFARPLAAVTARGYTLYFPFPYARRCLITVDDIRSPDPFSGRPMTRFYYQIGYRRYGADQAAHVRSYSAAELGRAARTIARVATALRDWPPGAAARSNARTIPIAATAVGPGKPSVTKIVAPGGGGEVTELRITTSERVPQKLRSTWLTIAFDGESTVDAPLIDFFGTGPAWNAYTSLPMTVADEGLLVCRFRMPFAKQAVVTIARRDAGTMDVAGAIDVAPAPFGKDSLLFHAGWRPRENFRTRPFRDWHVARIDGRGHQVGTLLDVENPGDAHWWGEGDEKIYIDGETFPGLFGTGTEDYFGYAWSTTERFEHPYHAQTATAGNGFGGLYSMNRFHILDPIPFQRSLRFDFEIWHWSDTTIAVDATLYWYARPGGHDDLNPRRP
jgi:hypothetical protein